MSEATLTVSFTEGPCAVDRIIGLLRRRGFPIAGMTLERTHADGIGRMTVVVDGPETVQQISRHLQRLSDVLEVTNADEGTVQREYALARVRCSPQQRLELQGLMDGLGVRTVSEGNDYLVVEMSGRRDDLNAAFEALGPFGIEESARTNPMAVHTGRAWQSV